MSTMTVLFVVTVVLSVVALISAYKKWGIGIFIYSALAIFFGIWAIKSAVENVGYGRVPEVAEPLSERLQAGIHYKVIGSIKDREDVIVFVKSYKGGTSAGRLYALRVKGAEIPPTQFTMIDGKPVAIVVNKKPIPLK